MLGSKEHLRGLGKRHWRIRAETASVSLCILPGIVAPWNEGGRWHRRVLEGNEERQGAAMRPLDCESWRPAVVLELSNEGISVEPAQGFAGQTHRGASRRPTEPAPNASIQGTLNALVYPLMNNFSNSNRIRDTRGHGWCSICQMSLSFK